jgi:glycosyltransferase involved in cell wall biosynthesis
MIDISIIIPCYNSGQFITEAIESVKAYSGRYSYEIIIIDDGSTDLFTIELLKELSKEYTILRQENNGPATARNNGCKIAKGRCFLFLDSDNKIIPDYIDFGIDILDHNSEAGVVYAKAHFFGDKSRTEFNSIPFDIKELLVTNYIDMCAIVRKRTWESVDGFDESPEIFTLEDWDFWLKVYEKGWKFIFIDKKLFYYRIREGSLMDNYHKSEILKVRTEYIFKKHVLLLEQQYRSIYQSLAYKTGLKILRPYRLVKKFFKQLLH